jgi:hypothetical protein
MKSPASIAGEEDYEHTESAHVQRQHAALESNPITEEMTSSQLTEHLLLEIFGGRSPALLRCAR